MVEHLYNFFKQKIRSLVSTAMFFALSADETTACNNTSWIAIHAYIMVNWYHVLLLLTIQKMDSNGATANKLTSVIMATLIAGGEISDIEIAGKLLCFGADGVSTFQGLKSGVTAQIKEKSTPFAIGVHYCAHHLNLAT